jgi:acetyltransferase-like isoleucine patch superfamily enzyme
MGRNVWISQMVYIDELHPEAITIGDNCAIGIRTSIISHTYWGARRKEGAFGDVLLEKNVYVGPHCVVMPNTRIGEGSVIIGGTVVKGNVPARTLWGPPAAGPLGEVTVPLIWENSYEDFLGGIRPLRDKGGSRVPRS